jgi:hypothetical protein
MTPSEFESIAARSRQDAENEFARNGSLGAIALVFAEGGRILVGKASDVPTRYWTEAIRHIGNRTQAEAIILTYEGWWIVLGPEDDEPVGQIADDPRRQSYVFVSAEHVRDNQRPQVWAAPIIGCGDSARVGEWCHLQSESAGTGIFEGLLPPATTGACDAQV